jgi:hypothetical protein
MDTIDLIVPTWGQEIVLGYDFKPKHTKVKATSWEWESLVYDIRPAGMFVGPNSPYWESLANLRNFVSTIPESLRESGQFVAVTEWTTRRDGKINKGPAKDDVVLTQSKWDLIGYEVADDFLSKTYTIETNYTFKRREDGLFDDLETARRFVCEFRMLEYSGEKQWIYGMYVEK